MVVEVQQQQEVLLKVIEGENTYPDLYSLVTCKDGSIADCFNATNWNLHFKRNLQDCELESVSMLITSVDSVVLTGDRSDSLIWMQSKMEFFIVNSSYDWRSKEVKEGTDGLRSWYGELMSQQKWLPLEVAINEAYLAHENLQRRGIHFAVCKWKPVEG